MLEWFSLSALVFFGREEIIELSSSRAALPPTCTASSVFTIVLILGPRSGPVRGTPILHRGK